MVGDIRGMWPLSANGSLSLSDASIKADTLTNTGSVTAATGVRGVGADFGSSNTTNIFLMLIMMLWTSEPGNGQLVRG